MTHDNEVTLPDIRGFKHSDRLSDDSIASINKFKNQEFNMDLDASDVLQSGLLKIEGNIGEKTVRSFSNFKHPLCETSHDVRSHLKDTMPLMNSFADSSECSFEDLVQQVNEIVDSVKAKIEDLTDGEQLD